MVVVCVAEIVDITFVVDYHGFALHIVELERVVVVYVVVVAAKYSRYQTKAIAWRFGRSGQAMFGSY